VNWEPLDGDRIRCARHDVIFRQGREICAKCKTDPGPELELELDVPDAPPEGCLSSTELERRLTADAKDIETWARALVVLEDGGKRKGRINYATAFKGYEVALKFYNAAQALNATRERRAYIARLERRQRALHRRRGGHN